MKKVTGILLTFTFVLYLGGVQIMYWLKMSSHKQKTETTIRYHKIPKDTLVRFSFTSSEYGSLAWSDRNKEFTYQGQRYDVIAIKYYSDKIILTCYSDKEETNLVNAFSGFVKKLFASPQHTNDTSPDIANNLCKEYLPSEPYTPPFYSKVLISIKAQCSWANLCTKPDAIWHPPTLA